MAALTEQRRSEAEARQALRHVESQQRAGFQLQELPKQARAQTTDAAAQTPPPSPAVSRSPGSTTSSNPSFRPCHVRSPYPNAAMGVFSDGDAARWGSGRQCNTPSRVPTTRRPPREHTKSQPPAGTPTRRILSRDLGSRRSRTLFPITNDKPKRFSLPSQYVSHAHRQISPRSRPRLDLPPPSIADFRHGANLSAF
jgi:hypothetical protein